MTKFRPCIDLHAGKVKQIVGGTLTANGSELKTNHVSAHSAGYFATLYKECNLTGAHLVMLGPGNDDAAMEAIEAWKGGIQVAGGITDENARSWIDRGAEKVIVTSFLFPDGYFSQHRVESLLATLDHDTSKLVIDLSCRRREKTWYVALKRWTELSKYEITEESVKAIEPYCSELLIHAADVEGLQSGIDELLVEKLGQWCSIPVTYAGGVKSIDDLDLVKRLSNGKVDLTIGSALDVFGGSLVKFEDCVRWNEQQPSYDTLSCP